MVSKPALRLITSRSAPAKSARTGVVHEQTRGGCDNGSALGGRHPWYKHAFVGTFHVENSRWVGITGIGIDGDGLGVGKAGRK